MADFNNRPKAPKTLLDDPFLRLTTDCPTPAGQGRKSKLAVVLKKYNPQSLRNPHMVVYTGDPTENDQSTDYGKITAKFDYGNWGTAMETIADAVNWEPGEREMIVCKDTVFTGGGQRSKDPLPQATLIVGKDKDGVVCLSIKHFKENRPVIVFKMLPPPNFHEFKKADGTPLPLAELSKRFVRSYVRRMEGVVKHLMVTTYEEPAPYDPNNRGGGGGNNYGNRGGNGGGGNNYRSNNDGGNGGGSSNGGDEWASDIPF